jgi:hypothetical protein
MKLTGRVTQVNQGRSTQDIAMAQIALTGDSPSTIIGGHLSLTMTPNDAPFTIGQVVEVTVAVPKAD